MKMQTHTEMARSACLKRIRAGRCKKGDLETWLEADFLKTTWHLLTPGPEAPAEAEPPPPRLIEAGLF
jgi:hypothetical protein